MSLVFFVPAIFEFTIFFLMGFRACQDAKVMTSLSSAPLLTVLYRDGIICFFIMFGVRMWNIWIVRLIQLANADLALTVHIHSTLPNL